MAKLLSAAAASSSSAPVTARKCPMCHNGKFKRSTCNRCDQTGLVKVCGECEGSGLLPAESAPRSFVYCGHCGGTGLEPKPRMLNGNTATRAAKKRGFTPRGQTLFLEDGADGKAT